MTFRAEGSLGADATMAAFPLGGIGTGNVSVNARGQFCDWELFNTPGKGARLPYSFFTVSAAAPGEARVCRVLEAQLQPPYGNAFGVPWFEVPGLPRLDGSRLRGEYPFVWVDFEDASLPVKVQLEAFTPLVPLDSDNSGLPCAVIRYNVHNDLNVPVDVTVAGSLANGVGFMGRDERDFYPKFVGDPHNRFRDDGVLRGIDFSSSLSPWHLRHGSMSISTTDESITAKPDWGPEFRIACAEFWEQLSMDGRLGSEIARSSSFAEFEPTQLKVGSLAISHTLEPGAHEVFQFFLTWHFPNRPMGWPGWPAFTGLEALASDDPGRREPIASNFYATWLEDAWAVGRHLHTNLNELEGDTRKFHARLHGSNLPPVVIDAASANIAALRSTTCFRLADGTLAGWEGTGPHAGSCAGSCTHVWNYAQTVAYLFPDLERTMRKVEFALETDPDGRMNFRVNRMFGREALWELNPIHSEADRMKLPAVDGQLGSIVRLFREWRFSGDEELIRDLWPHVYAAIEYALREWDADGDCVLDTAQHTTYDIDLSGQNSLCNSLLYAALAAAARMAESLAETDLAERYRRIAAEGSARMDDLLWNGEYYEQRVADTDAPFQYGHGCLSDQVFGQFLAHVAGLGYILPEEHVREALRSVYRHNFRPDLSSHHHSQISYAHADEAGLVNCSWPRGGRPRVPLMYCDQIWTGVEYQVAAHLIYEGLVDEGLEIVQAVRARHDGYRRNPWNEVECGNHYARAMSSWALVLALSGFTYDAPTGRIGFRSATPGELTTFFSTGDGWGQFHQDDLGASITLDYGSLVLGSIVLELPHGVDGVSVGMNTLLAPSDLTIHDTRAEVSFGRIELRAGETLHIAFEKP